jgi:hypothetical protein
MRATCQKPKERYAATGKLRVMYEQIGDTTFIHNKFHVDPQGVVYRSQQYDSTPKSEEVIEQWEREGKAIVLRYTDNLMGAGSHQSDNGDNPFFNYGITAKHDGGGEGETTAIGLVRIGIIKGYYAFIDAQLSEKVTISGDNNDSAVVAFGDMLKGGARFKVTEIVWTGSDDASFKLKPNWVVTTPNGEEKKLPLTYPSKDPSAQTPNVRSMKGQELQGMVFTGNEHLLVPIPEGTSMQMEIKGHWIRRP